MTRQFRFGALGAILLLTLLSACTLPEPDPAREAEARAAYAQLASGDYEGLKAKMASKIQATMEPDEVAKVRAQLPPGRPLSVKTWRWSKFQNGASYAYESADEYAYPDVYVLASTRIIRPAGAKADQIELLDVQVVTKKQLAANELTLEGKTPVHYAFVGAMALVGLITLIALFGVFTRKGVRGGWLWFLFILLGFAKFTLNWTTGAFAFQAMSIQLLSLSAFSGGSVFDPWFLSFSIPLGALIFLGKRGEHAQYARAKARAKADAAEAKRAADEPR
jgi:hypothetical protein